MAYIPTDFSACPGSTCANRFIPTGDEANGVQIIAGSVTLIPSGVLKMKAFWSTEITNTIHKARVYILTNFRDPPSSAVHKHDANLVCLGRDACAQDSQGFEIGDFNRDDFVPGNDATSGNFLGFQLGLMYRVYIEIVDADGSALNDYTEISSFSTPIIKATHR